MCLSLARISGELSVQVENHIGILVQLDKSPKIPLAEIHVTQFYHL